MRLRPLVKNILGIIVFYSIIILGVILLDNRMAEINAQKNVAVPEIQTTRDES